MATTIMIENMACIIRLIKYLPILSSGAVFDANADGAPCATATFSMKGMT